MLFQGMNHSPTRRDLGLVACSWVANVDLVVSVHSQKSEVLSSSQVGLDLDLFSKG